MKRSWSRPDPRPLVAGAVILWLALSPWLWGFASSRSAVANHVSLVLGVGPLALMIVALRPAACATLAAGIWLALSPWVLGYATNHVAWANDLVTGVLLVALSAGAAGFRTSGRTDRRPGRRRRRFMPAGAGATNPAQPPPVGQ